MFEEKQMARPSVVTPRTALPKQLPATVKSLVEILKFKRSARSAGEDKFIEYLLQKLPKTDPDKNCRTWKDPHGNIHCVIATAQIPRPYVLFCSHTDTMHNAKGPETQDVYYDPHLQDLVAPVESECLGADDGTGVWLMLQLIRQKVPGYYIFHRDEEIGGLGSQYVAKHYASTLRGMTHAIAFDRRGKEDIITHQGTRTCSDEFARELAAAMKTVNASFNYSPCKNGTFTDTKNYAHIIPECTNLSVGYFKQHTNAEYQNVSFAQMLHAAVAKVKWHELGHYRDETRDNENAYPMRQSLQLPTSVRGVPTPKKKQVLGLDELEILIKRFPAVAAELLVRAEVSWPEFEEILEEIIIERHMEDLYGPAE